jgi:hypothetical protein
MAFHKIFEPTGSRSYDQKSEGSEEYEVYDNPNNWVQEYEQEYGQKYGQKYGQGKYYTIVGYILIALTILAIIGLLIYFIIKEEEKKKEKFCKYCNKYIR